MLHAENLLATWTSGSRGLDPAGKEYILVELFQHCQQSGSGAANEAAVERLMVGSRDETCLATNNSGKSLKSQYVGYFHLHHKSKRYYSMLYSPSSKAVAYLRLIFAFRT